MNDNKDFAALNVSHLWRRRESSHRNPSPWISHHPFVRRLQVWVGSANECQAVIDFLGQVENNYTSPPPRCCAIYLCSLWPLHWAVAGNRAATATGPLPVSGDASAAGGWQADYLASGHRCWKGDVRGHLNRGVGCNFRAGEGGKSGDINDVWPRSAYLLRYTPPHICVHHEHTHIEMHTQMNTSDLTLVYGT